MHAFLLAVDAINVARHIWNSKIEPETVRNSESTPDLA